MAPNSYNDVDAHPGGLASKVRYEVGTTRYTGGMAFVFPVCEDCGALLADQGLHDDWTDEKLAETTGLALAHVETLRESAFGPLTNPEHVKLERAIVKVTAELASETAELRALISTTLQPYDVRLRDLQQRLTKLQHEQKQTG